MILIYYLWYDLNFLEGRFNIKGMLTNVLIIELDWKGSLSNLNLRMLKRRI